VADVGDRNARRGLGGFRVSGDHFGDAPSEDAQRCRTNPFRPHHAPAAQEKLAHSLAAKKILGRWNSVTGFYPPNIALNPPRRRARLPRRHATAWPLREDWAVAL